MLTDYCQHLCTGGMGLGGPSCPWDGYLPIAMPRMGQPRHDRVATAHTGRGALDGAIRPLPLRCDPQMGPALLAGRVTGPSCNARWHHRARPIVEAGRAIGAWIQATLRLAHEHP